MGRAAPSARRQSWRDPPPYSEERAILDGDGRIQMPRFYCYQAVFELLEHMVRPELSAAPVTRGEGNCGPETWAYRAAPETTCEQTGRALAQRASAS